MNFNEWLLNEADIIDRAKKMLKQNPFGGCPFSESDEDRKKMLITMTAERIAGNNMGLRNKIIIGLYAMKEQKPKVIKPPVNDEAMLRMRFGSDWDKD